MIGRVDETNDLLRTVHRALRRPLE